MCSKLGLSERVLLPLAERVRRPEALTKRGLSKSGGGRTRGWTARRLLRYSSRRPGSVPGSAEQTAGTTPPGVANGQI
jgi:hypothetical protein